MTRLYYAGMIFAVLNLVGCDGSKYVSVSGTVTLNGEPLANVMVTFQPMSSGQGGDTGGVGSFAMTDSQGKFTLEASTPTPQKGALVGKHKVRIATPPPKGADTTSDVVGTKNAAKEQLPVRYNSESTLEFEVPSGGTDKADFKLTKP